jgi:predicted  nucleic acid-binding Zn-ribbon protein
VDKDEVEKTALELMTKADELKKQVDELEAKLAERQKVRGVASAERDQREHEIRDRLNELRAERAKLAADVPKEALAVYDELLAKRGGEDVMAPVEEQDRKRHEITCGSCMMSLPVETVSTLISGNRLIRCVSCGCILYMEQELAAVMNPGSKVKAGRQ